MFLNITATTHHANRNLLLITLIVITNSIAYSEIIKKMIQIRKKNYDYFNNFQEEKNICPHVWCGKVKYLFCPLKSLAKIMQTKREDGYQ